MADIYLASRSPRRRQLLQQIGIDCHIIQADVDETPLPAEAPDAYVLRLAQQKAEAGVAALPADAPARPLLAADTAVVVEQQILGKPDDEAGFIDMMQLLSGRRHQVLTGIAVSHGEITKTALSTTEVHFRELSAGEMHAYWRTGEPHDKAGGYGIQGHGAIFIREIRGSYSGVMGLPLYETAELLRQFGVYCL